MQRKFTCLWAGITIISLLVNAWLLVENRRLFSEMQIADTHQTLRVHVVGAVTNPGLLELPRGSRVADALQAAGGAQATSDLTGLNLAKPLFDGEQIVVPVSLEAVQTSGSMSAALPADSGLTGLVNINSAGEAELQTLPGIGPVKAAAIVAYRQQHGAFARPEDIMNVSGIGEKTYEKLKPLIIVR